MKFVLLINLKLLTIANSFLLNIAEHVNFSANEYENANLAFSYLLIGKISCLSELSMKKSFITSGPDLLHIRNEHWDTLSTYNTI